MSIYDKVNLLLVSGVKNGIGYWKIDIFDIEKPLNEINNQYLECYRKELLGYKAALVIRDVINRNINNIILLCRHDGFIMTNEIDEISYDLPLQILEEIFDFWIDTYRNEKLWKKYIGVLNFYESHYLLCGNANLGLRGDSFACIKKLEYLHSFRPNIYLGDLHIRKPMW